MKLETIKTGTKLGDLEFISGTTKKTDIRKAFGEASRVFDNGAKEVYDDLGFVVRYRGDQQKVYNIDIYLSLDSVLGNKVLPKKVFKGKINFREIAFEGSPSMEILVKKMVDKSYIKEKGTSFVVNLGKNAWWFYPESNGTPFEDGENLGMITLWERIPGK